MALLHSHLQEEHQRARAEYQSATVTEHVLAGFAFALLLVAVWTLAALW